LDFFADFVEIVVWELLELDDFYSDFLFGVRTFFDKSGVDLVGDYRAE
jgi:hypothetical protein